MSAPFTAPNMCRCGRVAMPLVLSACRAAATVTPPAPTTMGSLQRISAPSTRLGGPEDRIGELCQDQWL